jgi:hypothetical protein
MQTTTRQLLEALHAEGYEAITAPQGGFFVKGHGHMTIAQARKITGIQASPRPRRERQAPWGDFAIIAAMSGRMNG